MNPVFERAIFAGGCFWCTEEIFKRLKGVISVIPGYSGGNIEKPSYEQVCSGITNHAEAIQIEFDPEIISYEKLLEVFFATHDPTTLNRQGTDIGTQYRSIIFYRDEKQKETAEKLKQPNFVTEIIPFKNFYKAEDYHQNYYEKNKLNNSYCAMVIDPKIRKLMQDFAEEIKEEYR